MNMAEPKVHIVASFVVAHGHIQTSQRGSGELHMLLADELGKRLSRTIGVGDFASGTVLVEDARATVSVSKLPRGVARAQVVRLVSQQFVDLGELKFDFPSEGKMAGDVDHTWPYEWREKTEGKAILDNRQQGRPLLYTWTLGEDGAPLIHSEALERLGLTTGVCLTIDPRGACRCGVFDPATRKEVEGVVPGLDARLWVDESWDLS